MQQHEIIITVAVIEHKMTLIGAKLLWMTKNREVKGEKADWNQSNQWQSLTTINNKGRTIRTIPAILGHSERLGTAVNGWEMLQITQFLIE